MSALPHIEAAIRNFYQANPDRDLIIFSKGISRNLHKELGAAIQAHRKNESCTLFMTTYGGDPHGGFRIARCIRHYYKHVRVVIPSFCKSAGTLIAICADELVIGDYGELGPLDIQVSKPTEFMERSSGLDIMQALQMNLSHAQEAFRKCLIDVRSGGRLSTKLAGEFASKIATGVVEPLYAQIDPNRIGELQRAMRIAHEYGERLNRYGNNLKMNALNQLIAGYPSHDFVIDRKEAADLFMQVSSMSADEVDISSAFWNVLEEQGDFGPFVLTNGDENDGNQQSTGPDGEITADAEHADAVPERGEHAPVEPADPPAEQHDQGEENDIPGELGSVPGRADGQGV